MPPFRRSTGRVLRVLLMLMVILGLIAGASFAYVKNKIEEGHTAVGGTTARGKDDALPVLVLGSDSRAGLSAEELTKYDPEGQDRGSGRRADTIMLLHIDPKRQKAILISFPRDLKVTYIPPSEIRVTSLSGAGAADSATVKKTQSGMNAKSSGVMGVGTASPHETTTVYYVKGHHEKAGMVAGLLGAKITEMPASIEVPSELDIVLGSQPTAVPSQQPSTPKATKSIAPPAKTPVPKPLARRCDG